MKAKRTIKLKLTHGKLLNKNLQKAWRGRPRLTPTGRLTLGYLAVLMGLSLILTIPLYRASVAVGEEGLRRERLYFEGVNPNGFDPSYQQIEEGQFELLHRHLREQLLGLNLIILALGGALSYFLARRSLAPIESALAAQSQFAADASHELRTPLTAMKSEIEVALRDPKLDAADARELLTSNLEEVVKLEGLASGLLRLARHENDPLPLKPVELSAIAERAISRLETAATQHKVTVDMAGVSGTAAADQDSLVELVVILLDNAIKYSEPGSSVIISSARRGGHLDLSVKDSGAGIDAADLPHIFERFFRADSSRSKRTPGYGLGLSIAARIADLHGGSIDASSRLGAGSTFTVHLRAAEV